ncbi:MAG: hypothetical protein OHK0046_43910 [Anaerolineae bacterium]
MRILIVEDYTRLLRLYEKILTLAGHEVHKASTLLDARDLLEEMDFDVCLLDVHLGFRSGIDLFQHFPQPKSTRFIVVSGWDQYRDICEAANIDFHLKPISNRALVALVANEDYNDYLDFLNRHD